MPNNSMNVRARATTFFWRCLLNSNGLGGGFAHVISRVMSVITTYEHIVLNQAGVQIIKGTNTKIVEIVSEIKAYGWSPEEIHFQHLYLSLRQIYSALVYYWDNSDEMNRDMEKRLAKVSEIRRQIGSSEIKEKLEEKGLIFNEACA